MRPRTPLVVALAGWTGLGLVAAWIPQTAILWQGVGVLIAALAAVDLLALRQLRTPKLICRTHANLPLGDWGEVRLRLRNRSTRPLRFDLHDLHPAAFAVQGLPCGVRLPAGGSTQIAYRLRATERGDFQIPACEIALRSPLGLWVDHRRLALSTTLKMFPNLRRISRNLLPATRDRLARPGEHRRSRRGEGGEFHQLRDYRQGDGLRRIDWKASARVHRLIAREYEDEQDQQLVFLLDTGRRMRHRDAAQAHLDEALDALLPTAFVALRHGDAVGLMTYGGPLHWLAPRSESRTMSRLLELVYAMQPSLDVADPLEAARTLLQRLPRRALVVMITNSRNEDQPELEQAARLLRRRHLLVIADLRESALDRSLEPEIKDLPGALRFHAVQDWLEQRQRHQARLRHLGVEILDALPAQLPGALIARYRAIKHAGRL